MLSAEALKAKIKNKAIAYGSGGFCILAAFSFLAFLLLSVQSGLFWLKNGEWEQTSLREFLYAHERGLAFLDAGISWQGFAKMTAWFYDLSPAYGFGLLALFFSGVSGLLAATLPDEF